ncbi:MAG: hypothetical protein R2852_01880 [Bacteroidia bacterium]
MCQIIRDEMNKEEHLLETVAENILIAIMEEWSIAESSNVKILKMHPRFVGIETEALKVELSAIAKISICIRLPFLSTNNCLIHE